MRYIESPFSADSTRFPLRDVGSVHGFDTRRPISNVGFSDWVRDDERKEREKNGWEELHGVDICTSDI